MSSSYVALGYDCNHKCIICPCTTFDRMHKTLMLDDIKSALECIDDSNHAHIVVSGGEPTINDKYFDVLDFLTKKNFKITVLSNSEKCKDKGFVERLVDIVDLSKFNIVTAVHSGKSKIHDYITGCEGSFERTIHGLENLLDFNVGFTVKHIFNKLNYQSMEEFALFVNEKFPSYIEIQFCSMDFVGRAEKNAHELAISFKEIQHYFESALDIFENHEVIRKISVIETPLCSVDPYYWKYFKQSRGNLALYAAPNGYENNVSSQCGTYYSECEECVVKSICPGVWRSTYELMQNNLLNTLKGV